MHCAVRKSARLQPSFGRQHAYHQVRLLAFAVRVGELLNCAKCDGCSHRFSGRNHRCPFLRRSQGNRGSPTAVWPVLTDVNLEVGK